MLTLPDFVAIIGYSFGRTSSGYDDLISLEYFLSRFHRFSGNIYTMSPDPWELCEVISEEIESDAVIPVSARWNLLAHAMVASLAPGGISRSLNFLCESLLDKHGHDRMAFPLDPLK